MKERKNEKSVSQCNPGKRYKLLTESLNELQTLYNGHFSGCDGMWKIVCHNVQLKNYVGEKKRLERKGEMKERKRQGLSEMEDGKLHNIGDGEGKQIKSERQKNKIVGKVEEKQ